MQNPTFAVISPSQNIISCDRLTRRVSDDPVLSVLGQVWVGMALSMQAELALTGWVTVSSRLCTVRLNYSVIVSGNWLRSSRKFAVFRR